MKFSNILVVCRANICRSLLAEELLRTFLGRDVNVFSAGTRAVPGTVPPRELIDLAARRGLDLSGRRARRIRPELISRADLIMVMELGMRREVAALDPRCRGKIYRLGEWRNLDIPDPAFHREVSFADALDMIEMCVSDWVYRIGDSR